LSEQDNPQRKTVFSLLDRVREPILAARRNRCGRRPEPGGTRRPVPVMPLAIAASVPPGTRLLREREQALPAACPCLKSASLSGLTTKGL